MSDKPLLTPGVDLADLLRPLVKVKVTQQSCRDGLGPGRDSNWIEYECSPDLVTIRVTVNNDCVPMGTCWNGWCEGHGDIPMHANLVSCYFDEPANEYVVNYEISCEPICDIGRT